MLLGRRRECEVLTQLLEDVWAGRSRALVVRGEAGVGKTALLEHTVRRATRLRVARAVGVQSEMELPFAGLHQLGAPMLDRLPKLPRPQRDALLIAFGLDAGNRPDRFLVGLAVLGLLAEVAQDCPLICVVDDAQWLDRASAQALAFAARRLRAESVALVFASRGPDEVLTAAGLPELLVGGLPAEDAGALLESVLPGPIDAKVRDRVVAETRGNPLALLELPKGLTLAELSAGSEPTAAALSQRIERSFQRRMDALPEQTRHLLLVAASEPLGDPVLLWRAAQLLGIGVEAAAPLAEAGLLEIATHVRFRHPLERSAIYRAAVPARRRAVHRALAEATDAQTDPDRRTWHLAQAAQGPDEDIAADLVRSADRAQARGGLAAASAFLERAAELTPDPTRRADRALAAAKTLHEAGTSQAASRLLSLAEAGPCDELRGAEIDLLRAQIGLAHNRGSDAPPQLLKVAKRLAPLDARLARQTYLDALLAAMFAGGLASGASVREVAEAARAAPPPPGPPGPADLLLDGLALRFTAGYAAAIPTLRQALDAFRAPELPLEGLRWLWLAHITAGNLWEEQTLETDRHIELARVSGALSTLPLALTSRIGAHVYSGELSAAAALLAEADAVSEVTGIPLVPYGALLLAAWRGQEAETLELIEATTKEVLRRGEGFGLIITGSANAMLHNSLGRYEDALVAAIQASEHPPVMGVEPWLVLVELIEAASRVGQLDRAADALARLTETTRASGTDWALGIEARSRALLADGAAVEIAYRTALVHLRRTRLRGELARAQLLYGEWLRRRRRRGEAREQLRGAYQSFVRLGAEAFAQRAEVELLATGETARKRTIEASRDLTAQETQIIRLVREGLSNSEIAARLFLSRRTIEWHLSKIFGKLNITSRRQLRG